MTAVVVRNVAAIQEALTFGPAMSKLPPQRQAFVLALLADDKDNGTAAAVAAGITANRESARTIASRLRHDPAILAAIGEVARSQLFSLRGKAVRTLQAILDDPVAAPRDKARAAAEVLNRTDMPSVAEQKITIEHKVTGLREQIVDILQLAKQLNYDPRPLLGSGGWSKALEFGLVQEGEFEEVPSEPAAPMRVAGAIAVTLVKGEPAAVAPTAYDRFLTWWNREVGAGVMAEYRAVDTTGRTFPGRGYADAAWQASRGGILAIHVEAGGGWTIAHKGNTP